MIKIDRNPPGKQLALFAVLWVLFVGTFGVLAWAKWGMSGLAYGLWGAAVGVPLVGAVYRPFLRWVYVGMAYAAFPIGYVLSHVLLGVIYYLLITPIGLLLRLFGKDPMSRQLDPGAESYWLERKPVDSAERYFKQY